MLLVKVKLGSPVIFRQVRPGRDEQPFCLFKFRTMTDERDSTGRLLPDADRLGTTGEFLRRTSLDELPELFNVLKGEMSLVGPRPLLMRYLPHFSSSERARFTVRPGITGLAQVSGRNDSSWDERLQKDIQYVKSLSFRGDIKILWLTVLCVLRRDGYQSNPNSIMSDFDVERELRMGMSK
jgi:lipopolysaccharide/colanic/teichoic acid biosynthesis glycosyltransferase